VRAAAHRHGVTAQAIYNVLNRQLKRQKNASKPPLCPCCGQPVVEPNGPRRGQRSS
jgi:hypothetical protein